MKYKDNGEYNNIYVKSFDTLPVGSEVDFDGSVVPNGWTAVSDILWTNSDDTQSFSSQTIAIDGTGYNFYMIVARYQNNSSSYCSEIFPKGFGSKIITGASSGGRPQISYREIISSSNTEIKFDNAGNVNNNGYEADNTRLIPKYIIGLRF